METIRIFRSGGMKKLLRGNFGFKGIPILGLLLALLLLLQSFLGYFRVSSQLITNQLEKEAERQTIALERELRTSGGWDPAKAKEIFEEIRREAPKKLAWVQVFDSSGKLLAGTGQTVGEPSAPGRIRSAFEERVWISAARSTPDGRVRIAVLPLRVRMPRPAARDGAPVAVNLSATPSEPPPGPRLIELALYEESVAEAYGPLRRNLITSCLAAMSLAIAMVLLWLQFPRYVRSRQLEEQLELARRVQADLLPSGDPSFESLDFAASCVAAWQVGGDFYDVFPVDRGRTAFVLGDVSGKGIPAALLMGMLHGAVRAMTWSETAAAHESSSRKLNGLLASQTSSDRFASLFWGYHDPETHTLRYVNAGHLPPALIRRDSAGKLTIQRLTEGGPVLGVFPEAGYRQGKIEVQPGDLLILYSDGIVEAATSAGEEFAEERLWTAVQDHWDKPTADIRDEILRRVQSFLKGEQPQDDITLVVMRLEKEPERSLALSFEPACAMIELPARAASFQAFRQAVPNSFTSI